jgi:cyclin-dependent kinase 10
MTDKTNNVTLTTVKGTQIECHASPFYGKCRDVEDFEKLNRVGEGTYGVV